MDHPNLNYIEGLSGGDLIFKGKLIAIIKAEFPEEKASYLHSFQSKNYKETAEMVHKLKNKISMLGMQNAYLLAQNYEEDLKLDLIDRQEDFLQVLDQMSQFINNL